MTERFNLLEGNCLEVMATMAENSIDSIVTDPPYELGFMGKSWDSSGIAFNVEVWQEALRVLKPGGHLLAFSGSRTYHRMAVAIEDAGFEIRDQIMWVYGSGFPKSHNIEKAINKIDGVEFIEKPASGVGFMNAEGAGGYNTTINKLEQIGDSSDRAADWQGWGTALKPAHEPIVVARKPLIGTVANNVLTFGTGGLNIDGARVGSEGGTFKASKPEGKSNGIYGEGINGTVEIGQLTAGRWPANFIHDGSDEVVALFPNSAGSGGSTPDVKVTGFGSGIGNGKETYTPNNRTKVNNGSGSAARFFYCAKASKKDRNEGLDGFDNVVAGGMQGRQDGSMGSITMNKNHHPTVKPTSLMQYLVRLVTPPNGIVLDPFLGSGSTGKAAMYEGFNFIGIELTPEYLPIAKARIEFALASKELELDFDTP